MVDKINIVANVLHPQYFSQWKMTSSIWKMEDYLNYLEIGRRPQFFGKWNTTSQLFWQMEITSMFRQMKDHIKKILNGI
jgi:hypothetical protein